MLNDLLDFKIDIFIVWAETEIDKERILNGNVVVISLHEEFNKNPS